MQGAISARDRIEGEFKRERFDDPGDTVGLPELVGGSGSLGGPRRTAELAFPVSNLFCALKPGFSSVPPEDAAMDRRQTNHILNRWMGMSFGEISCQSDPGFNVATPELAMPRVELFSSDLQRDDMPISSLFDDHLFNCDFNGDNLAGLDDIHGPCARADIDVPGVMGFKTGSQFHGSPEGFEENIQVFSNCGGCNMDTETDSQGSEFQSFGSGVVQHLEGFDAVNYKRPKVLSEHMHNHGIFPLGMSQGVSSSAPSTQGQANPSHEREEGASSASSWLQNNGHEPMDSDHCDEEEGGDSNGNGEEDGSQDGMGDDRPSMDLSDDLLHMVFYFLDQKSLCNAAMVCRQWRIASGHEDFWKSLTFKGPAATQDRVGWLCRRYPGAVDVQLVGVPLVDEVAREAMHSLCGLEILQIVSKGILTDSFFNALATGCFALQHLSIAEAILGNGGSQEIQVQHESLRELDILKCRVLRVAIRCPLLEKLSLKRTSIASAMLHCPRLHFLDVSSCHKLSDAGVRAAATACSSLQTLDISRCSFVSDETLREISLACPNLHVLDASYCPNITLEGVRMTMLRQLRLDNCEGINSSSMAALSQCFMLEIIRLDFCALLTAVVLDLQRLQTISLLNCRKFVDLILRCPALMNINVATCPALNRVDISSLALKRLVLQKQPSLTTMSLQCPHLRNVDLTECDSLNNSIFEVFSEGGGCPRLNSLTLDSCESLTMVRLSSTSLKCLSLAGCRKIHSINLACANLQQLRLDGCDHLSAATFAPVGLQSLNLGICPRVTKLKVEALSMTSLELKGCGVLCEASICCPQLLSLDASYCSRLEDECLEATTTACPFIQSLILASCPSVGPAGLSALRKLSNLTTLDLSYTFLTELNPIFQTCPQLKVLRLLACKYLVDTALDSLHGKKALPELRELDLSYGSLCQAALEGLLNQCLHLTHVSLNGCMNLYDLDWDSTSLSSELSLMKQEQFLKAQKFCENGEGVLMTGCDGMHNKEKLDRFFRTGVDNAESPLNSECADMTQMDSGVLEELFSARSLQHLNCVGCPNIKRVVIPGSACFHDLSSLNLSLSNNVKEVRLECPYLMSLNLSHCSALDELDMKCPRLVSLSLQACGIEGSVLESALQGCGVVETLDIRNCAKVSSDTLLQLRAICPRLKRLVNTISAQYGGD